MQQMGAARPSLASMLQKACTVGQGQSDDFSMNSQQREFVPSFHFVPWNEWCDPHFRWNESGGSPPHLLLPNPAR
jgi:hypothetical protein